MKKIRKQIAAGPSRKSKPRGFEGVRKGVATSGSSGPEVKNLDLLVTNTAVVTGTPYIASMTSALAEGVASGNRVGVKVHFKSWDVRMNITTMLNATIATGTTAITGTPAIMDVFYVWDKQPDGATPAVATIFTTTTTPLTFGNIGQLDRFVVLRRKRYVLDGVDALLFEEQEHIPLDITTRFPDATGAPNTNDFYIVAICNNAQAAATLNGGISYVSRLKFTDA